MRVPVVAQSSYYKKTYRNPIQGGSRLDVVMCNFYITLALHIIRLRRRTSTPTLIPRSLI